MTDIRLKYGLKIFCGKGINDRIELSNGVECVSSLNGIACRAPVYVARKPWRRPSREEMSRLLASEKDDNNYQFVSITPVPDFLKKQFEEIALYKCATVMEVNRVTQTPAYLKALQDTVTFYEKIAAEKNAAIPHHIYFGEPNLPNNTYNKKENYFIGLHLDSWEQKASHERAAARNRICINLGKEPRWLLFYNVGYMDMGRMAGFAESFLHKPHNPYEVLYKFFDMYADYPVLKIRIDPYEAYIAPTENIIHDGCTEGTVHKDINLAIRGYYRMPVNMEEKPEGVKQKLKSFFKI